MTGSCLVIRTSLWNDHYLDVGQQDIALMSIIIKID